MAVFTADLSKFNTDEVNKSIHQVNEDTWIVDLGTSEDAVVLTLTTAQAVRLGLLNNDPVEVISYVAAARDYLLGVIEQDEMNYMEYYPSVKENMLDLYGEDFDMESFGSELDKATKELKQYLRD